MLSGNKQRVLADHEIPADRSVPGTVGTTEPKSQSLRRFPPAFREMPKMSDRRAIVLEEQLIVINSPTSFEVSIKRDLALQNRDGARTQLDNPIFVRLGRVLVDAVGSGLGDR